MPACTFIIVCRHLIDIINYVISFLHQYNFYIFTRVHKCFDAGSTHFKLVFKSVI